MADEKDKRIPEVPHLEVVTGEEKIPVSAGGEPGYVEVKQIVEAGAVPIEVESGEQVEVTAGKFYRFDEKVNELQVQIYDDEISSDRVHSLELFFSTGDNPHITIDTSTGRDIDYYQGFSIEPNTTYELNFMFDGEKWIVAYAVVE